MKYIASIVSLRKTQQLCYKAVENYPHPIIFVPEWYKMPKMSDKAIDFILLQ